MKVWHHQIIEARTWQELLGVAREYIASLTPQEWDSVPRKCRPDRIKGIDDLAFWQQCLAETYLETTADSATSDVHRKMLALFTAAAERASEIYGSAPPAEEDAVNDVNGGKPGQERKRRDRA